MPDQPRGSGFSTLAIHAGLGAGATPHDDEGARFAMAGSVVHDAGFASGDFMALSAIRANGSHPATAALEERMAALEGGPAAVAVATGAAAQVLTLHTLAQQGEEIVAARPFHASLGRSPFESFGWTVKTADPDRPESFVEALSDKTKAIFIDSIVPSGGAITDIEAIATIARRARVPLIVDNTFATPYLVRPFEHGADIVLHSTTRLLAGHGGAGGGIIIDGGVFDWLEDDRYPALSTRRAGSARAPIGETFGNYGFAVACREAATHGLGPALSPFDAALVLHGIETLPLRLKRQADGALAVAHHLARHSAVDWVRYAGLVDDPDHELAQRYCPRGAGVLLSFGLAGGHEAALAFAGRLRLFARHADAGATRSLIICPASGPRNGGKERVTAIDEPGAVFVSIGLEDTADIVADLDRALGG